MVNSTVIFFSLVGGILPALFWLYFWLREDKLKPEPRALIMFSFLFGMIAVIVSLYAEKTVRDFSVGSTMLLVFFAPLIEETTKFFAAYFSSLRKRENDEPIDPIIYLITSALGFAALENALFLLNPISDYEIATSIASGGMRFIGATLLHVVASATIGIFISFAFYKNRFSKFFMTIIGLIVAVTLHSFFNFFIMNNNGENILAVFGVLWVLVIFIILIIEKIKRLKRT
ncbi:MAG: PrsW family glutamic-type intramembrane protease [Patescibacteria group bacterium]